MTLRGDGTYILRGTLEGGQIAVEAEAFQEELPDKPVTMALREVAEGKLTASLKDEYME